MATKYVCDKCDNEFAGKTDNISSVNIPVYSQLSDPPDWPIKCYDLCNRCMRKLSEFLKPDPKDVSTF